ncbi:MULTISPECIES: YraN family protein [unclassified Motilimonas]|uniref:YraN family protein n=1 Tax=Motilimonas TaxID=1914248 RepID=UPI001E550156|nr:MULTISPECIES: YraN family protein [unclassified Motilimonas]MCE0555757.1 YraN family protein [Motilimonas sp. E26]MDO6524194.1 YraN family protein [Motilimonas sp. 1_MG-2023]
MRAIIKRQTGDQYEQRACDFLISAGLSLVCKNYVCRFGEIDLIMQHDDTLVFVEVRYRADSDFGGAIASVTRSKQRRIIKAAKAYLMQRPFEVYCRFDVVAFESQHDPIWLQNAFQE